MLTAQEKARILAKIRKDSYGITLEQMKQYFYDKLPEVIKNW